MKVLNLRCANGHGFEGWFASDDDFMRQNGSGLIECPLCGDKVVMRMPAAPRLNLSGARAPVETPAKTAVPAASPDGQPDFKPEPRSVDLQALWLQTVRHLMERTEDVGERFAEQARRMHYGELPTRGIRGQATPEERAALQEEGIETITVPVPRALKGPVQ